MKQINGSILDIERGIICHQVNCRKVMGAGVAKQLRYKWPEVYRAYMQNRQIPGKVQVVPVSADIAVVNLFGQVDYDSSKRQTNYEYIYLALLDLKRWCNCFEYTENIYFPYGMSSGLAGGDWNIISAMIESVFPNAIIVKYKG